MRQQKKKATQSIERNKQAIGFAMHSFINAENQGSESDLIQPFNQKKIPRCFNLSNWQGPKGHCLFGNVFSFVVKNIYGRFLSLTKTAKVERYSRNCSIQLIRRQLTKSQLRRLGWSVLFKI